jgi:hypothetical protein
MSRSENDIYRLFQSAAEILMNLKLQNGVVIGTDGRKAPDFSVCVEFAVECPPTDEPRMPTTREDALPHILLRGPFKGAPSLHGVAFYIGLGLISIREIGATRASYEITAIDGDGMEARLAFLVAARDLFFTDVKLEECPS